MFCSRPPILTSQQPCEAIWAQSRKMTQVNFMEFGDLNLVLVSFSIIQSLFSFVVNVRKILIIPLKYMAETGRNCCAIPRKDAGVLKEVQGCWSFFTYTESPFGIKSEHCTTLMNSP